MPTLRLGEALWMVGRRSFLVQHRLSQIERELVYTDCADGRAPGGGVSGEERQLYLVLAAIAAAARWRWIWLDRRAGRPALRRRLDVDRPRRAARDAALRLPSHLGDPRAAWPRSGRARRCRARSASTSAPR